MLCFFHRQSFQKDFLSPRWFPKSMVNVDSISMPVSSFVKVRDIPSVYCHAHFFCSFPKDEVEIKYYRIFVIVSWQIIQLFSLQQLSQFIEPLFLN